MAWSARGKIAGTEYLAFADDGSGKQNVTMLVQIPATFNAASPCIVTAASSGSRGVYGAIATAGEWGLKKVAPSPTPTRAPAMAHDLAANTVFDMFGRPTTAMVGVQFVATRPLARWPPITVSRSNMPIRSRTRLKDWGKFTLQAVKFAFFAFNEEAGAKVNNAATVKFTPDKHAGHRVQRVQWRHGAAGCR